MYSRMCAYVFYLFFFLGAFSVCQGSIGVCNGRRADNPPLAQEVVALYKSNGIKRMRLYAPHTETLSALKDSDIELILDVPNNELQSLQSDASTWVQTNIVPYFPATKIRYIAVGNEVDPAKSSDAPLVLPAMKNLYNALSASGFRDQIKVSTATYSALLMDTSPPSQTTFNDHNFMDPIIAFLAETRAPLLVNIYPYFAYTRSPSDIPLPFALFTSEQVQVQDGSYGYQNLFDAMVDGVYYALEKVGGGGVDVVVSESGWPSEGGDGATTENAGTYYQNLIGHVGQGTPRKMGKEIETYLFAMFDENRKEGAPSEQHFGLFNPVSKQPKYQLNFNGA